MLVPMLYQWLQRPQVVNALAGAIEGEPGQIAAEPVAHLGQEGPLRPKPLHFRQREKKDISR